jgi:hypothetical protein
MGNTSSDVGVTIGGKFAIFIPILII